MAADAVFALYVVRAFELARRTYPQVTLGLLHAVYRPEGERTATSTDTG